MGKHSKRNRGQMQQSGMDDALRVVHRLPKVARRLPQASTLDADMEFRLRCIEHSQQHGVAAAFETFKRSRTTVYRWLARYDPIHLRCLRPFSRRGS